MLVTIAPAGNWEKKKKKQHWPLLPNELLVTQISKVEFF